MTNYRIGPHRIAYNHMDQVTSANDRNVSSLVEAVFFDGGLTSCDDTLSYDTILQRIQDCPAVSASKTASVPQRRRGAATTTQHGSGLCRLDK